jgi:hypothetical protein
MRETAPSGSLHHLSENQSFECIPQDRRILKMIDRIVLSKKQMDA